MDKNVWYYKRLQDMYSSKNNSYRSFMRSWDVVPYASWASRIKDTICKYFGMNPKVAGIFDCCCGDGAMLECFRLSSNPPFKVKGFDISEEFVEMAHKKGRNHIHLMDAADVEETESWYVIAFDSFEHLPVSTLDKLLTSINKFGLVLIAHNFVSDFRPEEYVPDLAIDHYDYFKETGGLLEHYILQPYSWWLQKLDEKLTNFTRVNPIPAEWDIIGRPHKGLLLYRRK